MFFHKLLIKSNKGYKFLKLHLFSMLIFGFIYWIQDYIMTHYSHKTEKSGLGKGIPPTNSLFYWLWFSAITQTTIGYNGPASQSGVTITFAKNHNLLFKIINLTQIMSVFLITAYLIK